MLMRPLRAVAGLLVLSSAIWVAACGSDNGSSTSSSSASTSTSGSAVAETQSTSPASTGGQVELPTGKMKCGATALGDDPCKVPAQPPDGKAVRIGYFGLANNTFSASIFDAIKATVEKYNATVTPLLNPFSFSVQASQIRDSMSAKKFDAYIVFPTNPAALAPAFRQMAAQKIPFVTVGGNNGTDNSTAKVTFPGQTLQISRPTDSYAADAAAATKEVCQKVDPCKVGFIRGSADVAFDTTAYNRFVSLVKATPNVKLVQTVFGAYLSSKSTSAMKQMLTVHPDLDVVVTLGDQMSAGAQLAIQQAGKAGKVQIVSVGGGSTAVKNIREKKWYASVVTLPSNEGIIASVAAIAAARGVKLHLGIANIDTRGPLPSVLTQRNESQWTNFTGQWSGL